MRSCCALYVDAGYLVASAATRVAGTSLRGAVHVDHEALIRGLIDQVEKDSGLALLRVHWYDSGNLPGGRPDPEQAGIGMLPRVKLRLGRRGYSGEQKGVDLRLGLDLVNHARTPTVDIVYLVSGDDDLTEAVEQAQDHGIHVNLLAVPTSEGTAHAVARHLQREADALQLIDAATIDATVHRVGQRPAASDEPGSALPDGTAPGDRAATVATPASIRPLPAPPLARPIPAPLRPRPQTAASTVTYSTTTGVPLPEPPADLHAPDDVKAASIDAVCRHVIGAWARTASDHDRADLMAGRPQIPSDIDRALLIDLAARLNVIEVDDRDRKALRARFWQIV